MIAAILLLGAAAGTCPNMIVIAGPQAPGLLRFELVSNPPLKGATYRWTISAGTIQSGQGKTAIAVKAGEGEFVTATVEVGGIPVECPTAVSASDEVLE